MTVRSAGRRILECLILMVAVNCGKTPPPVTIAPPPVSIVAPPAAKAKTSITIAAAPDVNPDRAREPKPVVVRVYQLKADAVFANARFEALDDDDEKTLGETFVTRDEFTLQPGQRQVIDVVLSDATQYIGVVAAFRDINDPETVWRAVSPIPTRSLTIDVSGRRVVTALDPAR